ncbi:MAG: hypothetical protein KGZ84_08205 [Erysipelotrichia bacterium]|jgi:hypothetical protein|nr:hypothetical protein [Erysipelotrichia bacterium]
MSLQEKRSLFSVITGIILLMAYGIYVIGKLQSGSVDSEDIKFWANAMLLFIGIGIVVSIITQIIFHIVSAIMIAIKEKMINQDTSNEEVEKIINTEMMSDEMDKLIELKSMRVGFIFSGIGFVCGLIALALNYSPVVMLNMVFASFSLGSILEGFQQFLYYRKGVQ